MHPIVSGNEVSIRIDKKWVLENNEGESRLPESPFSVGIYVVYLNAFGRLIIDFHHSKFDLLLVGIRLQYFQF
jgi:hypothetical protein